ncbi:DUF1592 domain-containing protein [Sandaracinus amylolyticus]|uniref:DUF1592 domain-containing protein n=1 Tax=Sandaracinus amylolyticus TaxID=927083 RepID=UPI001F401FA8|nr:DUF1592 domain-containing protein [Sandaracinus amylolyticus]UJR79427.1 Cellulose-binding domain protein [Sandaracinus amylolyticus]
MNALARRTLSPTPLLAALALPVVLSGCQGELFDGPAGPGGRDNPICRQAEGCAPAEELPSPASRFPRLSHHQYENTVRDLLRIDATDGITDAYLGDATSTTFDNNGNELYVGEALWGDYQRGAESLAERVTTDATALARIVPEGAGTDARRFVEGFGLRAHRRPLTADEVDGYVALFARGATAYPEMDTFAGGVRVVLEAMLQSPYFLYRVELSTERDGDVIPLSSYEIASRLSYALWDTMPDDALFEAARGDSLRGEEGIREQAARLLADDNAADTVAAFHYQLLDMTKYEDVSRSTMLFPEFTESMRASMVNETQSFVRHVIFEENGGFSRLMTAPYTFVDAELATVYGLDGTYDDAMERVDLDPAQRGGLLTQIGFLAAHSSSTDPDAIHRGVFVNHRILCAPLPPPPMMVPPLPADETGALTMRERIDAHTGPGTCGAGCHGTMINPIGFAFEHYDALGRWRDQDHGQPVDASAEYTFDGTIVDYEDAVALSGVIAEQPMAHRCYVRHWLEYAYGRPPSARDNPVLSRVGSASIQDDLSVQEILVELVASQGFRTRSTTELED